jgi:hypothetical protein
VAFALRLHDVCSGAAETLSKNGCRHNPLHMDRFLDPPRTRVATRIALRAKVVPSSCSRRDRV